MQDKFIVKGEVRSELGKNVSRRLRSAGKVPVSIYGGGTDNVAAAVELKDLAAVLRSHSGQNTVFELELAGQGSSSVMFQDRQIDPLTGRLIHADLRRISKGEKFEITVPIHLIGKAAGLSEDGAILNQPIRTLKILVEPALAPDFIEVDVSDLGVNESIHVSDIAAGSFEIHAAGDGVVASVTIAKKEAPAATEAAPAADAGAAPEGDAKPGA
ncbi:MAG: 50S ribosomal protein L25 [Acidobacteriota bacterium]